MAWQLMLQAWKGMLDGDNFLKAAGMGPQLEAPPVHL